MIGHLVEIDPVSRQAMKTGKLIVEEGGWIQSSIRNDQGRVARLLRVRGATAISALSGGSAVLGAIAAQAQAAEMARDIKAIRRRVDELSQHLRSDHIGAVENAVKQVEDLVADLRAHGQRGVSESGFSVAKNSLGQVTRTSLHHLRDAVARLENAGRSSLRQARKDLGGGAVEEVMLHLDLTVQCYVATVQFGLAEIAFYYHQGKPDIAQTRSERITTSVSELRAEIEDLHGQLSRLDEDVRDRFRSPKRMNLLSSASSTLDAAASTALGQVTNSSLTAGKLRGIPLSLVAVPFAITAKVLVHEGLKAAMQPDAEKDLERRLGQLAGAGDRSSQALHQAAPNLGMLRTLAEELAGPSTYPSQSR
ncbi:hypothetical protein ACIRVI_00075 [[Kitasatospora] papulosa]|uniref:hypothetical protein n=1 Tax=Streptomyces TaxID=1883 RepID=UPI0025B57C63|nr:hypothetical protein [Streptomyces sp. P9-2B-1]WJY35448.1 hypothetical protein QTO28_32420 [Streptomyces sp. P9-2B-1]